MTIPSQFLLELPFDELESQEVSWDTGTINAAEHFADDIHEAWEDPEWQQPAEEEPRSIPAHGRCRQFD